MTLAHKFTSALPGPILCIAILSPISAWASPRSSADRPVPETIYGNVTATDADYVRVRCADDGSSTYIDAFGSMYAHPEGADPVYLFDFVGVDVSRCVRDGAGRWWQLSRKVSLYLDPVTKEVLRWWKNPITSETLNVMHRAYDYQEFLVPKSMSAFVAGEVAIISHDFNTNRPNPLSTQPKFAEYSPFPTTQSADSYKFIFPRALLGKASSAVSMERQNTSAPAVALSYYRVAPWEPWMKMGKRAGKLVLNYSGARVSGYAALPERLRDVLEKRVPLLKEAPACRLDRSNARSTSRFNEQFESYLAGDEFPSPEPVREESCRSDDSSAD
jgi:hypothetical protein